MDILDPSATTELYILDETSTINQIQIETKIYGENIKHKLKDHTYNNKKITTE